MYFEWDQVVNRPPKGTSEQVPPLVLQMVIGTHCWNEVEDTTSYSPVYHANVQVSPVIIYKKEHTTNSIWLDGGWVYG